MSLAGRNHLRNEQLSPLVAATDPRALLALPTVCALISLSKPTLYRMVAAGEFPKPMKVRGNNRWKAADVHAWLAEHGGEVATDIGTLQPAQRNATAAEVKLLRQLEHLTERVEHVAKQVNALQARLTGAGEALSGRR